MKKILTLAALLTTLSVFAQYSTVTVVDGTGAASALATNAVGSATATRAVVIPASTAGFVTSIKTTGPAGTNAMPFILQKSYDGVTWSAFATNTVTGGGSNVVVSAESALTLNAYGWVKLVTLTNTTGSSITNMTVKFFHK